MTQQAFQTTGSGDIHFQKRPNVNSCERLQQKQLISLKEEDTAQVEAGSSEVRLILESILFLDKHIHKTQPLRDNEGWRSRFSVYTLVRDRLWHCSRHCDLTL